MLEALLNAIGFAMKRYRVVLLLRRTIAYR